MPASSPEPPLDLDALAGPGLAGLDGPDLADLAPEVPDPLAGVEYTGGIEVDAARELVALEAGFKTRAKAEAARFALATDTEYWFAVCFRDRASKNAFLTAAGLMEIGDKYLDGHAVARLLGVDMPTEG